MLYAISDIHLSLDGKKPMDKFSEVWINHHEKLRHNLSHILNEEDTIILAGDTSWAMRLKDANQDLEFVSQIPGRKIILEGNHDYWFEKNKINIHYSDIFPLTWSHFYEYEDAVIVGTRGWLMPYDKYFHENDLKIYKRELGRLNYCLENIYKRGYNKIILCLHYPPYNEENINSEFMDTIFKYKVDKVIYGHLHGVEGYEGLINGIYNGVEFVFVAADYVNFMPIRIL